MKKFSVVIPLYNKRNYIKATILSVLKQTFSNFEIIVVNDGSTDDSLDQIKDITDSRLRIVSQKNAGVSVARNTGIKEANGNYIAFLDADDYWNPDYLETINSLTVKYPESDIYVTAYRIVLSKNRINYSNDSDEVFDDCMLSYWETLKNRYEFVWTSATTIKKQAIVDAGYFTPGEKVGEDLDMFARVAQGNPRVAYSTKRCVDYNRSAENNARVSVRVAFPNAYLSVLSFEMENPKRTREEIESIILKYDKKMIAYIFTLILSGERTKAKSVSNEWNPDGHRNLYKVMLMIANYLPNIIIKWVFSMRLKAF
ncbi:glycosyltransferase family 2 protein [Ureibacillus aquaedulcis]|uniref:Glycosyltransferase family A protein n=1 Tax=Ureibacillus aquaedulcis TaxID=3058421 RepID=A0ABT8GUQ9_9BACL|nr:glycosyltransferase family A protein [Ureibacillus sp. BA0131]MDN4495147.1 glycosyltransferase family A protein [Ureibacillus sp. BA0131]